MDFLQTVNFFDANSIISTLGLIGVLAIIFMETGLLIGLVFPGGEVVFFAGMAASDAGAKILGAPLVAIIGGEVGYWFGKTYGRKFFERPDSRFFNQKMVKTVEKWLVKYGPRKALVIGRFIPFGRTLINPICGVVQLDRKTFSTWNAIGAVIWTQVAIGIGFLLGDALSTKANTYLYGVVGVIVLITAAPLALQILREWRTKRHLS